MSDFAYLLLTALFLPLFPMSMGFNYLLGHLRHVLLRAFMLLLWPQVGLVLMQGVEVTIPNWIVTFALGTSVMYAFRALTIREVGEWGGFLATSSWALLWIPLQHGAPVTELQLYALGFSVPFVLLAFLGAELEHRFGAACTGLYGGLAESMPRFSTVLVLVVMAVIATPLFPAFFIMIDTIVQAMSSMPLVAAVVVGVWLLWSWAGAWLLQALITGVPDEPRPADLNVAITWLYVLILVLLLVAGFYGLGELS